MTTTTMKITPSTLKKVRRLDLLDQISPTKRTADTVILVCIDFFNKVWLGWTVAGLVTMGWYNYAPGSGEGTYLTKAISHYITPHQVWERINLKHLTMSAEGQVDALTVGSAKRPPVHRYRYPQ